MHDDKRVKPPSLSGFKIVMNNGGCFMKNRLFTIILMLFLSVGILSAAALAAPSAGGKGLSPDDPMVVPTDGMLIKGTTYYGISKAWFEEINPDKATMYFSCLLYTSAPPQIAARSPHARA